MRASGFFIIAAVLVSLAEGLDPYYGKSIAGNWGQSAANGLAGSLYAIDESSFQVIDFTFDGKASDSVFLLGTDKTYGEASGSGVQDSTATVVSNPMGTSDPLREYAGEDVVVQIPGDKKFSDIKYIAVYSRGDSAYLGGTDIPVNFEAPAPQAVGEFTERAHRVKSGEVTVLNDRMIHIKSLRYDGQGPDAFFYVGNTAEVSLQSAPYGKIPDENGIIDVKATAYSDRDIILTLPDTLSVRSIKWLSIYCISYTHNFGEVFFPDDLNVPPYMEIDIDHSGMNCEPLSDKLQVSWVVKNDSILFELAGNIDRETDYMAFGLSGSETKHLMVGADVVVADWRNGQEPRAVDYKLTAYAQCASNGGACPDEDSSNGGVDNVQLPSGGITNGIVRIKYMRPVITGDDSDKPYMTDGTAQQVVWAIGPINTNNEVAKHYTTDRSSEPLAIDFGRKELADNCPAFKNSETKEAPGFKEHHIYGDEVEVFTFDIGQSGSEQGYLAITGNPSWGIAWYVNGILVPELHLKRGVEYTFRVGGGTDPAEGSMYHPLYITDDEFGGGSQKAKSNETIYAGTVDEKTINYATGGYCEWTLTNDAIEKLAGGEQYQCFEEFQNDLVLDCADGSAGYTDFKWKADSNTPDILYYQCYTHANLGWKINLYDEFPAVREESTASCVSSDSSTTTAVIGNLVLVCALWLHLTL